MKKTFPTVAKKMLCTNVQLEQNMPQFFKTVTC